MRVVSIREPYATLIKNKIKYIETRSWNTHYRGEIYIHSCKGKYPIKEKIKHLVKADELKYGYIMCKANLVDCVFIDKEFAEKIKNENYDNYLCGDYSEGRYAWIISDIEVLDNYIPANGQLSIWNYDPNNNERWIRKDGGKENKTRTI